MIGKELNLEIKTLILFKSLRAHPFGWALEQFLDCLENGEECDCILDAYSDLCAEIYEGGGDLGAIVKSYIHSAENLYVEKYLEGSLTNEMEAALEHELGIIQKISKITSGDMADEIHRIDSRYNKIVLPSWKNTSVNVKKEFEKTLKTLDTKGYGIFARATMFKVKDGAILPVEKADYQRVNMLYGYERERNLVMKNTEALAKGLVASNVLLYGDAGTGKSTTVKAAAAHFSSKGVRLIEFAKSQVSEIPEVAESLADSPLKFIFFIDDLTFTSNDDDYYALKGILEGNVSAASSNILIYATSNRRHLIKESMADREGDDLHLNDTLQETMSLSSRFGLTVTFSKPAKDQYLFMVEKMAIEYGLLDKEAKDYHRRLQYLLSGAEAFAIRSNGRSPRTAKQYIFLAKNNMF